VRQFWKTLRLVPGGATSRYDWSYLLQGEWPLIAPLLRSTGTVAERISCPNPGGEHCPRQIRHWRGSITAVCADPEVGCGDIELAPDDLVVFELDVARLGSSLCRLLGCEADFHPLSIAGPTWHAGWYEPIAGELFAVCLTFPTAGDEAYSAAVRLVGHFDRPFILFAPAREVINPEMVEYLRGHRSRVLFLEDTLSADGEAWRLQRSVDEILREFRRSVLKDPGLHAPTRRFLTPPGTRWRDVTIRFITQDQVHVQVGNVSDAFDFVQMGMQDRRKTPAQPDGQWALLVDFAKRGVVRWHTTTENRRRQKKKEKLTKHLRAFFGIDEDPFEPLEDCRGWRARFRAMPEQ
jgi:hypothetical protein